MAKPLALQLQLLKMKDAIEAPLWARLAAVEQERNELFALNREFIMRIAELEILLNG